MKEVQSSDISPQGHKGHPGITKTKSILRERVWWPSMGEEVERWVSGCTTCTLNGRKEPPHPMERTRLPETPWDSVAIDFCGPYSKFSGIHVLVTEKRKGDLTLRAADGHTGEAKRYFRKEGKPERVKGSNRGGRTGKRITA